MCDFAYTYAFFVSGPKKIASVDVQSKPISLEIAMVSRFDLGNIHRLKWFWIVCLFFVHTIFYLFFLIRVWKILSLELLQQALIQNGGIRAFLFVTFIN